MKSRREDDAMREKVRRDLLAGIAEMQAEIQRLEAFLADVQAQARETDEEPAATMEGEADA
jgi:type II secretory pathway component PulM